MRSKLAAVVGATLVSLGLGAVAQASLLVDFKTQPVSDKNYETSWNGGNLLVTPVGPVAEPGMFGGGAIGNGDGTAAVQTPGGLVISTPFSIGGVAGGDTTSSPGTTTFFDVTMKLTALAAASAAQPDVISSSITVLTQPIGRGTFELWSSTGPNQPDQVLLLSGAITDMVLIGINGGGTASVQSTTINYTGGKIFDAMMAVPNATAAGSLSWSLLDVNNGGLKLAAPGGNVASFDGNLTGLFSAQVVPEPASLSLLGLGALGLLRRRRK